MRNEFRKVWKESNARTSGPPIHYVRLVWLTGLGSGKGLTGTPSCPGPAPPRYALQKLYQSLS